MQLAFLCQLSDLPTTCCTFLLKISCSRFRCLLRLIHVRVFGQSTEFAAPEAVLLQFCKLPCGLESYVLKELEANRRCLSYEQDL